MMAQCGGAISACFMSPKCLVPAVPTPIPSSFSSTTVTSFLHNRVLGWRFGAIVGSRLSCSNPRKRAPSMKYRRVGLKAVSERADFLKVLGTVVKLGKDGLDIGTKLVPEVVPRPLAQVGVAIVGFVVITTLLNSLFSTALFIFAIGAVSYFAYFYFNKEERPSGGTFSNDDKSTETTLEEARKIMDKYK